METGKGRGHHQPIVPSFFSFLFKEFGKKLPFAVVHIVACLLLTNRTCMTNVLHIYIPVYDIANQRTRVVARDAFYKLTWRRIKDPGIPNVRIVSTETK